MIVDVSAAIAVILAGPDRDRCLDRLLTAPSRRMSAASLLDLYLRVDRSGVDRAETLVDEFLRRFVVRIDPVTYVQARLARDAWRRFGDETAPPATLSRADCFTYALARLTSEPLLTTGGRFGQTDLLLA